MLQFLMSNVAFSLIPKYCKFKFIFDQTCMLVFTQPNLYVYRKIRLQFYKQNKFSENKVKLVSVYLYGFVLTNDFLRESTILFKVRIHQRETKGIKVVLPGASPRHNGTRPLATPCSL